MDSAAFVRENSTIFFLFLLLILPLINLILKSILFRGQNLPPGPRPWPVIGNIFHVVGKNPHVAVSDLSRKYGPLMLLRFGTRLIIFGSSPEAASEILKTHDRELSGRCAPKATPIKESDLNKFSLLWATDCSKNWKSSRILWKAELFSSKALDLVANLREKKVAEMVDFLIRKEGETVKIGDVMFSAVYNTLGQLCFSRDMIDLEDENMAREWKQTIWKFMEYSTSPVIADFFPVLDGLELDPLGNKKNARIHMQKMFGVWQSIIDERREEGGSSKHGDFLDFMIENGFMDIQILYMLLEILPAGTGTLISTLEWAMAELLKNKDVMATLQEELQHVARSSYIKESSISQLPYLNACVKETLRLHPAIAFLPHSANSTCQVMGYKVPENSYVFVNVWAMGRDPTVWKDPSVFKPERFLNSTLDYKGQDFEFLPFGSGRRICPGLPFANRQLHLILAALIACFDWSLPNGGDLSQLDLSEKYVVPLQIKNPLVLVPSYKH